MRYASIDIETTGLNVDTCDLLEIGVVLDDLSNPLPIDSLPTFHCYILKPSYTGEPYALGMHAKIFQRIANKEKPYEYLDLKHVVLNLQCFFSKNNLFDVVTVAGKNFASFDAKVLKRELPDLESKIKFHHRVFDVSSLYYMLGDKELPSSKLCMQRAGLKGEVAHTAVEDAKMVVQLIRHKFI